MITITQVLTGIVAAAFEKCGYDSALGSVFVSDRMDLCQFQCNGAFSGAKLYRKAPFAIADEIAAVLRENLIFKAVESVKPGFINLTLTDECLLETLREVSRDDNLGIPQTEKPETIILDYGGPNIAKPLHIGHLRAAIIGEALKRLARASGYKVIGDIHLGNWGLQFGLVIAELEERNPSWKCFSPDFNPAVDTVDELDVEMLNEIYPLASKKSKADEHFKQKADRATYELQNGREGYLALWNEIMRVSVADLKRNYQNLNVDFDLWLGESDAEKYVPQLIERLEKTGLMYESDGAMVVDVAEESDTAPIPPVMIKKTNNSNIYATTDLGTIIQRQQDFAPDKLWYVVDKRQSLHFTQVFRCAKKAGLVPQSTELEHLGFGTMNGSDGKPYKTRDGGVMRLSDLIETITNAAYEKINTSAAVTSEEDRREISRKIGIAAIKFGDLINHRSKDYVFDLDKFLSFEGKTGTYLLYTVTRINSILKKVSSDGDTKLFDIYTDAERNLILTIILSGEAFRHAISEKAPNYICENAYQLAAAFSAFYRDNYIISEQDENKKATWLTLCVLTRKLLLKHLDVLGIEPVESM